MRPVATVEPAMMIAMPRRPASPSALASLNKRIVACRRCPRLRAHCREAARHKPARFASWTYWGRPVPNLVAEGTRSPRILVVGLAPAAHGANRTGRMFTGDRSGDFLFRAMHEAGLCNQSEASARDDGLVLQDAAITAALHCAPPANKPTAEELANCRPFLEQTFDAMPRLRVVVCLGRIAHDAVLRLYKDRHGLRPRGAYRFAHGAEHHFDDAASPVPPPILDSYHPSQQNTFTGRLTPEMLRRVFLRASALVAA